VKLRVEMRAMVRELQRESGITTVFVTHDQEEALALSDRIAVMDRGRIVQVGSPGAIYAGPATTYAADFLGSANLIPVESELPCAEPGFTRWRVAGPAVLLASRGETAIRQPVIAARREQIGLRPKGDAHSQPREGEIAGQVEAVEFRGSITGYRVRTAVGLVHVDAWSVQHGEPLARGEDVLLSIPRTARVVEGG
jgi:iron(III) transport system ATP-binding protein